MTHVGKYTELKDNIIMYKINGFLYKINCTQRSISKDACAPLKDAEPEADFPYIFYDYPNDNMMLAIQLLCKPHEPPERIKIWFSDYDENTPFSSTVLRWFTKFHTFRPPKPPAPLQPKSSYDRDWGYLFQSHNNEYNNIL